MAADANGFSVLKKLDTTAKVATIIFLTTTDSTAAPIHPFLSRSLLSSPRPGEKARGLREHRSGERSLVPITMMSPVLIALKSRRILAYLKILLSG